MLVCKASTESPLHLCSEEQMKDHDEGFISSLLVEGSQKSHRPADVMDSILQTVY